MGQQRDRRSLHGCLGELAGFNGQQQRWAGAASAHLEKHYKSDPLEIITMAEAVPAGLPGEMQLRQLGRDYAALWLLQRFEHRQDPAPEQQLALWERTLSLPNFRVFDLVHAAMGWDVTTPRVGEHGDTALMRFVGSPFADELDQLLAYVPTDRKGDYLATRNKQGMTATHMATLAGQEGVLPCLARHGARLDTTVRIQVAGCRVDANVAHLAVLRGCVGQTVELIRLRPELFQVDKLLDYTPMEAGLMQLEEMLEGYGRKHFGQLLLSAFTAMASKGELQAVSQVAPEQQDALAQHYANVARSVNLAAHAQRRPLPYPEHMDVIAELVQALPPPRVGEKMRMN